MYAEDIYTSSDKCIPAVVHDNILNSNFGISLLVKQGNENKIRKMHRWLYISETQIY